MQDFCEDDVNRGNLKYVKERLDLIADARSGVRDAVNEYQDLYGSVGDQGGTLASLVSSINQQVRTHANSIWARVEELEGDQSVP